MLNAEEEVLVGYSRTFRHRLKNEYNRNWTGISVCVNGILLISLIIEEELFSRSPKESYADFFKIKWLACFHKDRVAYLADQNSPVCCAGSQRFAHG